MSRWKEVGDWIKDNAGSGAALVGSLVTGNVPGAIAAGVSLISGATGTDNPDKALDQLKNNPDAIVKLKDLYLQNEKSVRDHLENMTRIKLEDEQAQHHEAQLTTRSGDNSDDRIVRWTRPLQSWCSLGFGFFYVANSETVDVYVLSILFALPLSYAGLRQIGKGIDSIQNNPINKIKAGAGLLGILGSNKNTIK